jgi:hypothetical protein
MPESQLITFYRGLGPDNSGRYLRDVQQQSLQELEAVHNYIQWLFPLPEPSAAVPNSPVLTPEDIVEFRKDAGLESALLKSFEIMLTFYGLQLADINGQLRVTPAASFPARSQVWLTPYNHNFLRLTRILRCLDQLGCKRHARALLEALQDLYLHYSSVIGSTTFRYWQLAVSADRPARN